MSSSIERRGRGRVNDRQPDRERNPSYGNDCKAGNQESRFRRDARGVVVSYIEPCSRYLRRSTRSNVRLSVGVDVQVERESHKLEGKWAGKAKNPSHSSATDP